MIMAVGRFAGFRMWGELEGIESFLVIYQPCRDRQTTGNNNGALVWKPNGAVASSLEWNDVFMSASLDDRRV
jgi:hypothetical protein